MSQIKITAVQGLRSQTYDEVDHESGESLSMEMEQEHKEEEESAEIKTDKDNAYEDDFEDTEGEEEKDIYESSINETVDSSSHYTSTEKLHEIGRQSNKNPRKKSQNKKFKAGSNTKPPRLKLYQDQVRNHLTYSRQRSTSLNRDTMSDQEGGRRRGRKLQRRGQMKKYHSLEHDVERAGRDRLEQKFMELEELMSRPLLDTRKARSPTKQLQKMSKVHHHHPDTAQRRNNSQNRPGSHLNNTVHDEEDSTDRQAYTTIHKLQGAKPAFQVPVAYNNQNNASAAHKSSHNSKLTSKPPIPKRHVERKDSMDSTSSGSSAVSQPSKDNRLHHNGLDHDFSEDEGPDAKFGNVSPRSIYLPTDMHLKYSDNPGLQKWLKRKNTEYRQARKAERTKRREERHEKQAELEMKAARREKSSERVKQWMDMKRKEALKQQKEEKKRKKQQAQEEAALRAKSAESGIRGKRIDRPQSAPTNNKNYTPIRRPESAARLENGAYTAPKPPDSKFVYKRPVSGRVRLMKLQNEKNAKTRNADQKKMDELSPEEKEKKMRLSYDAWLITKRKDEVEKNKEIKRQKELIKSDPEMERLIPELAVRRIERISKEKKAIETGVSLIDDDVNKRFGGGTFGEAEKQKPKESEDDGLDSTPKPSSYNLAVEGSAASLVELNTRARPTSAKTRMPIPQSAFSPRRPRSAKMTRDSSPKVRTIMDTDHMSEPNPFKLPFSDDLGVPYHVRRVQERIFSKEMASQSNNSERPEPQGCASAESAACPKDGNSGKVDSGTKGVNESSKSDVTPRTSLVLLQQIEEAAIQSEQEAKKALPTVEENIVKEALATTAEPTVSTGTMKECGAEANPLNTIKDSEKEATGKGNSDHKLEEEKQETKDEAEISSLNEESGKSLPDNSQQPLDLITPETAASAQFSGTTAKHEKGSEKQDKQGNVQSAEEDDEERGIEGSAGDESPRRSMKKVSFSEDLTTIFEPASAETSSNFDDERGTDDKEPDPHMSLDRAPDPV